MFPVTEKIKARHPQTTETSLYPVSLVKLRRIAAAHLAILDSVDHSFERVNPDLKAIEVELET